VAAARFRLRMATQTGEKRARDEGFTAFPVDPFEIANKHDIHVEKKPPGMKGVSGALIFAEPRPIIIYSSEHLNTGFERFSVAHELGHYFLPDHPDEILRAGGTHFSRAGFSEGASSIELEADHFAAGLLMPDHLVRRQLASDRPGLEALRLLADEARVSLTAAAIRSAECARFPLCVVISQKAPGSATRFPQSPSRTSASGSS
jgi:Zn-dependent peptidase ImmA (M78 family)